MRAIRKEKRNFMQKKKQQNHHSQKEAKKQKPKQKSAHKNIMVSFVCVFFKFRTGGQALTLIGTISVQYIG